MKRVVCLVTVLALSVAVGHVPAQAIGDPQEGLTLVCERLACQKSDQTASPSQSFVASSVTKPSVNQP